MSGYDGPTTDPWDAIKQRQQREHEAAQEANRPGRTQTFQSVRKLWNAILELRVLVLEMVDLVQRMPWNDGAQKDVTGFDLAPLTWVKVADVTIARPTDKNRANVSAVALASILGTPNSTFNPLMQGRIRVNGVDGEELPLTTSIMPGGGVAKCAGTFGLSRELNGLTQPVVVELWLRQQFMDSLSTVDSFASLSVSVGFTRVG